MMKRRHFKHPFFTDEGFLEDMNIEEDEDEEEEDEDNYEDSDEDVITLGRSQNNRVKLKDISVSRNHCNIIKRKNQLYI